MAHPLFLNHWVGLLSMLLFYYMWFFVSPCFQEALWKQLKPIYSFSLPGKSKAWEDKGGRDFVDEGEEVENNFKLECCELLFLLLNLYF